MKLRKNIAISDSGFVFDPSTGNSFTTNPCGLEIIRMIGEGKSNEQITAAFVDEYDAREDIIRRDLQDFKGMLERLKLTE